MDRNSWFAWIIRGLEELEWRISNQVPGKVMQLDLLEWTFNWKLFCISFKSSPKEAFVVVVGLITLRFSVTGQKIIFPHWNIHDFGFFFLSYNAPFRPIILVLIECLSHYHGSLQIEQRMYFVAKLKCDNGWVTNDPVFLTLSSFW